MSTQGKHWVVRNQFRKWKDEIVDWVRSITPAKEHGFNNRQEVLDELNRRFGTDFGMHAFVTHVSASGIQLGFVGTPKNFGQKHWRHRAVGDFQEKKGYLRIKVAEPNKWMQYQRYLWEKATGKSAEGKFVIFLDGNNRNFAIENLECVSRGELAVMAQMGNVKNLSAYERRTLILRARLKTQSAKLLGQDKATKLARHLYYERVKGTPEYKSSVVKQRERFKKRYQEDDEFRAHIIELQRARRARTKGLTE